MPNFCQIFSKKIKKISAFVLVLCLAYGLTPAAEAVSVKLRGKIALGVILSGVAYTTHALIKRDRQAAAELRHQLGAPERVVQFERGFDLWRIEHYGERHYVFRNNRLLKIGQQAINDTPIGSGVTNPEETPKQKPCSVCKDISIESGVSNPVYSAYEVPYNSGVWSRWQDKRGLADKAKAWKFRRAWLGEWKNGRLEDWMPIPPLFHASIQVPSIFFPSLTDMPVSGYPRWSRLYLLDSLQVPQFVFSDRRRLATERSLAPEQWLSR